MLSLSLSMFAVVQALTSHIHDCMESSSLVHCKELIEEQSNDDNEGFASMGCKLDGSLAIKETVKVRRSTRKSKPSDSLDLYSFSTLIANALFN